MEWVWVVPRQLAGACNCRVHNQACSLKCCSCFTEVSLPHVFCRKFVDILPLNNDWSPEYKQKVQAMVQSRNEIRKSMLGYAAQFGKKL